MACSPAGAVKLARMNAMIDVRAVLPTIRVPTLVLHRRDDARVSPAAGRYLAAHIPGAKHVVLEGRDHPVWVGDTDRVLDEIEAFLTGLSPAPAPRQELATVLAAQLDGAGDLRSLAAAEVARFQGEPIELLGRALLARFNGPAARCAARWRWPRPPGRAAWELRCGLHTGELTRRGRASTGRVLTLARRIAQLAGNGQVLASRTVADLAGAGLPLRPAGTLELPGEPAGLALLSAERCRLPTAAACRVCRGAKRRCWRCWRAGFPMPTSPANSGFRRILPSGTWRASLPSSGAGQPCGGGRCRRAPRAGLRALFGPRHAVARGREAERGSDGPACLRPGAPAANEPGEATMRIPLAAALLAGAVSVNALAQPAPPAAAEAYADMERSLGMVPGMFRAFPPAGIAGAWAEFKAMQLSDQTALSPKVKELIGLAVSAQVPCAYCVYFHTRVARAHGATDQEIQEAVAMAAISRHWSTVLNGNAIDLATFQRETDAILSRAGK